MSLYTMTFQFADDVAFTEGVQEITIGVLGCKKGRTPIGDDVEFWDRTKRSTRLWRRVYTVQGYPARVAGSSTENDDGTLDLVLDGFTAKPYCRIYDTSLPRVTRAWTAADPEVPGAYAPYWPDVVPLIVELEAYSSAEWSKGVERFTLTLYVPTPI